MVPKVKTKGYGVGTFVYASATLWTDLCDDRLTETDSVAVLKGIRVTLLHKAHKLNLSGFAIV